MGTFIIEFTQPFTYRPESGLDKLKHNILKFLISWAPKANPDNEDILENVRSWYLEVCEEDGQPQREIGFDDLNNPVWYAPTERNLGFWTDSNMSFTKSGNTIIDKEKFEKIWHNNPYL